MNTFRSPVFFRRRRHFSPGAILFFFLLLLCSQPAFSQSDCGKILDDAWEFYVAKEYPEAQRLLLLLGYCDGDNNLEKRRKDLQQKIFDAIDGLRKQAEKDRAEAYKQRKSAEAAQREADNQRDLAQKALATKERIVDAFYFYSDRFALAFKGNRYGFVDKEGNARIPYDFLEALPFDYAGFARVKSSRDQPYFLIDTAGTAYPLATRIEDLGPDILALDLRGQQLDRLPAQILANPQLKVLLLGSNRIDRLPDEIGDMANLEALELRYNRLPGLPDAIGRLARLRVLDLQYNPLDILPETIGSLAGLTFLNLQNTRLRGLPDSFGRLTALHTLYLSSPGLTALPESFGQLVNLQTLHLADNQLDKLPESFGNLRKLRTLFLSSNRLKELPRSFGELDALQALYLSSNQLERLPEDIGNLTGLKAFYLADNRLTTLPESVGKMKGLRTLHLSQNHLSVFPKSITRLSGLEHLYLADNRLTAIPAEIGNMTNLSTLVVSNNLVKTLPKEVANLGKLGKLDISDNPIQELPEELFSAGMGAAHLSNMARLMFQNKRYADALKAIRQCTQTDPSDYAHFYDQAWYGLFAGAYAGSQAAAEESLALAPDQTSANAILALAYVLTGEYGNKALPILQEWKDRTFDNDSRPANDFTLQLLDSLTAAGIRHPDFERVRALLKTEETAQEPTGQGASAAALIRQADDQILRLVYDSALVQCRQAWALNALRPELARRFQEIAFVRTETGKTDQAADILRDMGQAPGNLSGDPAAQRKQLLAAIEQIDPDWYRDTLMKRYYPDMVPVRGGSFQMGCDPARKKNCSESEKQHPAKVSDFQIARTVTTVWQYFLFLEATGRKFEGTPDWGCQGNNPAVYVSWYDAVAYANWVSAQTGYSPAYRIDEMPDDPNKLAGKPIGWAPGKSGQPGGFRLPTEAEWEYAARGGEDSKRYIYAGGDNPDLVGWYGGNSSGRTHPVGLKAVNELGLYDMSGNVFEWCWDWYDKNYPVKEISDYRGPDSGSDRVLRGGSWDYSAEYCRVSLRSLSLPDYRFSYCGFRLARTVKL